MPEKWRKNRKDYKSSNVFIQSLCFHAHVQSILSTYHVKMRTLFISVNYQNTKKNQWKYLFRMIHLCMMSKSSERSYDPSIFFSDQLQSIIKFQAIRKTIIADCEPMPSQVFTYTSIISTLCKSNRKLFSPFAHFIQSRDVLRWFQTDLIAMRNP